MSKLEEDAKKWFLDQVDLDKRKKARLFLDDKENMKEVIEEYKQSEQYKQSKQFRNRIKIGLSIGVATVGVATGAHILSSNNIGTTTKDQISEDTIDENTQNSQESIIKDNSEFFESIENEKNTDERDIIINQKTKEIIVEAYNMQNPDKPITVDNLEILILNENVLEKKDRLGNCTYERVSQDVIMEPTETERLVKLDDPFYVFCIDGKTVAVYDKNGAKIEDKSIEQEDTFFRETLDVMNQSEKLKESFKYQTNEYYCNVAESNYENKINELLEESKQKEDIQKQIGEIGD